MGAALPRPPPHGVSVSSALPAQETRLAACSGAYRRTTRPLQPGKAPATRALSRRGRRVPAPAARAMGSGLPRPAARQRFECPEDTRNAPRRTAPLAIPEPTARTSRREAWRGPQVPPGEIRIRRHARRIRKPCVSKATLRRPPLAPERSACPVGTWAEGPKRLGGVSKYKGCARPARRTPIFARCRRQSRRLSRRTAQPRRKRSPTASFSDAFYALNCA